ncbi:MAG: Rid family detoxifying hydrolase [Gemmatimonadota bacterium]|nr:Rid family detoxifying hydrolase [Gemmatimonadota bacterium]
MPEKAGLPKPQGPYSLWVKAGGFVFISGQGPLDPTSGEVFLGDIAEQTRMTFDNIEAVLADAGLSLADVVKTTVFLSNMGDFALMNEVYAGRFGATKPARSTVEVAALPLGFGVEIEAVAAVPGSGTEIVRS